VAGIGTLTTHEYALSPNTENDGRVGEQPAAPSVLRRGYRQRRWLLMVADEKIVR
jgi:hypothetical protein